MLELNFEIAHGRKPKINDEGKIVPEPLKARTKGAFKADLLQHPVVPGGASPEAKQKGISFAREGD